MEQGSGRSNGKRPFARRLPRYVPAQADDPDVQLTLVGILFSRGPYLYFVGLLLIVGYGLLLALLTDDPLHWALVIAALPVAGARVVLHQHGRAVFQASPSTDAARRLEATWVILAAASCAIIGVMAGGAITRSANQTAHFVGAFLAAGSAVFVAAVPTRPRDSLLQILVILLPLGIGLLASGLAAYRWLALFCVPFSAMLFAVSSGVRRLLVQAVTSAATIDRQLALLGRQEQVIVQAKGQLDTALAHMAQGLCLIDARGQLRLWNRRLVDLLGLEASRLQQGLPVTALLHGLTPESSRASQIFARLRDSAGSAAPIEWRLADGRTLAVQVRTVGDGSWVATVDDVSEQAEAARRISYLASHDTLTGLPNRTQFQQLLATSLESQGTPDVALLLIDLDHFKAVNDGLGHPAGDALLRQFASRAQSCLPPGSHLARLGGDEFAAILLADGFRAAEEAGASLVGAMREPFDLGGRSAVIGTSIGIALASEAGGDPAILIRNADTALYHAKAEGRGRFCSFQSRMEASLLSRHELANDLRGAGDRGELELDYQPLLRLSDGAVLGFEALVRWRHPRLGLLQPTSFIGIAEETGSIVPLGAWVLREACRTAAAWPLPVRVAVNVSPVQVADDALLWHVSQALEESGLAPDRLELEITEGVLLRDQPSTLATFQSLRALGVRLAIDDFGAQGSSLGYLRRFPFDRIKMDRDFVSGTGDCAHSLAILGAIARLGADMGMTTTAEGIETEEQLRRVLREGWREAQGFFISRPLPADAVPLFLMGQAGEGPAASATAAG